MTARLRVWLLILLVSAATGTYVYLYDGFADPLLSVSRILAGASGYLLGISMGMGSFAALTGFPRLDQGYQKITGLVGFSMALAYSLLLLVLEPETYYYGFIDNLLTADILLGLAAMTILTAMAACSLPSTQQLLTRTTIRFVFSFGLLAYTLLIVRAVIIEWPLWLSWAQTLSQLPPPRIPLCIFAVCVLILKWYASRTPVARDTAR